MRDAMRQRDRPPDPYLDSLGEAMRRLRRRTGKTGREISDLTGLNAGEISGWETGARRPGLDNLVRYLRGVEADLADLQRELEAAGATPPLARIGSEVPQAEAPAPESLSRLDKLFERYLARTLMRLLDPDRRDD